jgi:hypothetical protein
MNADALTLANNLRSKDANSKNQDCIISTSSD